MLCSNCNSYSDITFPLVELCGEILILFTTSKNCFKDENCFKKLENKEVLYFRRTFKSQIMEFPLTEGLLCDTPTNTLS